MTDFVKKNLVFCLITSQKRNKITLRGGCPSGGESVTLTAMKILSRLGSPGFWCVLVPLALLLAQFVIELNVSGAAHVALHTENGPVETLQFIVLVLAFLAAVRLLWRLRFRPPAFFSVWVLLAVLGCFYVAGEEVSWGQHFLNWDTPSYWKALNDQEETNLHNTSAWLDQKPRLLLELGVLVGGLLLPFYRRIGRRPLPSWLTAISPPDRFFVIALIVLGLKLADKLGDITGLNILGRASEVIEFYLYYFVLLYMLHIGHILPAYLKKE